MKTISSWRPRSTGVSNGRTISRSYRWIRGTRQPSWPTDRARAHIVCWSIRATGPPGSSRAPMWRNSSPHRSTMQAFFIRCRRSRADARKGRRRQVVRQPCRSRKLYPRVAMMQSGHNLAWREWPRAVGIRDQNPPQMPRAEDENVIQAVAPQRSDPPFSIWALPARPGEIGRSRIL